MDKLRFRMSVHIITIIIMITTIIINIVDRLRIRFRMSMDIIIIIITK